MGEHSLGELISFLDGLPEPRIVMNADYRIIAANAAYVRDFGGGRQITGRMCYEVSHHFDVPCDQAGESCPLRLSERSGTSQRVLHLHHTPRGEEHVAVETTPIRDESGRVVYFVETMRIVRQASSRPAAQGLVGRSPAFICMLEKILRVANSNASVLLLGETGTGKELAAGIHSAATARCVCPLRHADILADLRAVSGSNISVRSALGGVGVVEIQRPARRVFPGQRPRHRDVADRAPHRPRGVLIGGDGDDPVAADPADRGLDRGQHVLVGRGLAARTPLSECYTTVAAHPH